MAQPNEIKIGTRVHHASGAWPCGCDDTDGEVTKLSDGETLDEDEPMAFVGTSCFWQWFPVSELTPVFQTEVCERGEHGECLSFICGCPCHD